VHAELIVGTEPEGNGGYGVGFSFDPNVNLAIAQQFSVSQATTAGSITVYMNGDGTENPQGNFTLQLMDLIGAGATAADILWSGVGAFPVGVPNGHAPVTFTGLSLPLDPGTYYLVVTSDAGPGTGWGTGAAVLPGGIGTVGASYVGITIGGTVADYTSFGDPNQDGTYTNFVINQVPEPAGILLLALGLCGCWMLRRVGPR